MSTTTPDKEDKAPNVGDSGVYDDEFNKIISRNYSPDEQSSLSEAARQGDSSLESPSKAASGQEINNAENQTGGPNRGKVDSKEGALADKLGKGFVGNTAKAALPPQAKALSKVADLFAKAKKKKKTTVAALLSTVVIVGGIFTFSIVQGPLQLIHLGEILAKPLKGQEDDSSKRFAGFLRFARSGEYGATRIGYFAGGSVLKSLDQLKGIGIEFNGRTNLGRFKSVSFDLSNSKNPHYGKSTNRAIDDLVKETGLPRDSFRVESNGRRTTVSFDIDTTSAKNLKVASIISGSSLRALENGKIVTAIKIRNFKGFFGLRTLFSPLRPYTAAQQERLAGLVGREKATAAETERAKPRMDAAKARAAAARAALREKVGPHRAALTGALVATTGLCLVYESADDAVEYNQEAVVGPAIVEATDKIALGAQVKSGDKTEADQVGDVVRSFADTDGKSPWSSAGLKALQNGGKASGGEEMPPEYGQAFSGGTTADNIKSSVSTKVIGVDITGWVCSPIGFAVQAAGSVILLASGPVTLGGSWAIFAAKAGAGAAATMGALYLLQNQLTKILADDTAWPLPPSGPVGGNMLAYGARAGANLSARSSGGVELSQSDTKITLQNQEREDKQEFMSKNFFARIFDFYDYRSLAGKTVIASSNGMSQNFANAVSALASPVSLFSRTFSSLTPKAAAAEDYNWGFALYGIPNELLNDENYADPYENADKAVEIFTSGDGGKYIEKANKCFGVEIGQDSEGLWNAVSKKKTEPSDKEYTDAKCNDLGDAKWKRVILFVFDTRISNAGICFDSENYEGYADEVCAELGAGGSSANISDSGSSNNPDIADGSVKELAQKMLEYKKQGKYKCDNAIDCQDIELTAAGQSIANGPCTAEALGKKTLQMMIYLIDKGYSIGTFALCRSHSAGSRHSVGLGIDISSINGKNLGSDPSSKSLALEVAKTIFDVKGDLAPTQIITAGVGSTNRVDADFVKYNRVAPGNEGASAVAAFGSGTMNGHDDHIHIGY